MEKDKQPANYHWDIMIKSFTNGMMKRNLGTYAGSTAFFFLLSIFPTLILFSAAIPSLGISETDFIMTIEALIPDVAYSLVYSIVSEAYNMSFTLVPITILMLLWTCARGMLGLMYGLNTIYDVHESRGYFYLRFLATLYTILIMILFALMLGLVVFGNDLNYFLRLYFPKLNLPFLFLYHFRYVILIIPGILLLSLIYKMVPGENLRFLEQVPGAAFTVLGWIIFSIIFSFFTERAQYSLYYGSLTVIILFMLWLYWCIYIILIGGYINWFFQYLFRTWIDRIQTSLAKKIANIIIKYRKAVQRSTNHKKKPTK